jgi:putative peptide zinc metalloprotease protein
MGSKTRYTTRAGVEILEFDNRLNASARLVVCGDRHYELGQTACTIVESLQQSDMSLDELHNLLQSSYAISPERLQSAVEQLCACGIIRDIQDSAIHAPTRRKGPWLMFPLLPASWLAPFTNFLSKYLYVQWVWAAVVFGMALHVLAWIQHGKIILTVVHGHSHFAVAMGLLLFSVMMHELGHAAACRNRGVRHGPIGIMIYTVFPALYTDVNEAWRLCSRDRLLVDSAGLLISFLLASAGAAMFLIAPNYPSAVLLVLNDSLLLVNLNPFLKMDGYWIISDLLRVPNLMGCNQAVTSWAINVMLRRKHELPAVLRAKRILSFYLTYYVLWCAFLGWFGFCIFRFCQVFFEKAAQAGTINAFLALSFGAKMQVIILFIILARMVYSTASKIAGAYRIFQRNRGKRNESTAAMNLSRWTYPPSLEKPETMRPKR